MLFLSIIILITCKALPWINENLSETFYIRLSSIILILCAFLNINMLNFNCLENGISIYSGLFNITVISQTIETFIFIIGSFILFAWPNTNKLIETNNNLLENNSKFKNYYINYSIIILFNSLGASLLISSYDLISIYLSIELQSFALYILSTLSRESESSTSAGLKYFLLGGLSSCLILLGSSLIYAFTGLTNLESIFSLISSYIYIDNIEINNVINYDYIQGISLGLIIIFIGFLFKISAAPLHNWAPDVYNDTPTLVTLWLTLIPKLSILILLLELFSQINLVIFTGLDIDNIIKFLSNNINILNNSLLIDSYNNTTSLINNLIKNLLFITSFLSLIIGSIVGLSQTKIKRLLAYSTIAHIGFILLSLAIYSEQSIDSFLFYIIQYTITNLNIFLIIIALNYIINFSYLNKNNFNITDIKYISEFKGLFLLNPFISLCFSICLFSMAGIPPLIGFFSKLFVLYSATQQGYYFISLVGIFVSVISCVYYLKIIRIIFSEVKLKSIYNTLNKNNLFVYNSSITNNLNSNLINTEIKYNPIFTISNFHSYLISVLTLSILLFILKPSLILSSTQLLSLSLFKI